MQQWRAPTRMSTRPQDNNLSYYTNTLAGLLNRRRLGLPGVSPRSYGRDPSTLAREYIRGVEYAAARRKLSYMSDGVVKYREMARIQRAYPEHFGTQRLFTSFNDPGDGFWDAFNTILIITVGFHLLDLVLVAIIGPLLKGWGVLFIVVVDYWTTRFLRPLGPVLFYFAYP
jgi:hypothetical protein